jgi:hypothetical protein
MAESSRPPTLPSTADTTPYAPVSWLAVAAMGVAGLFAIMLLFAGYGAFREKRPLLQPWLLALPAAALVFSFAARRVIRNSEGTRTGELFGVNLPNAAWWLSLVLMLGYGAYLLAIDFAIRRDARTEVERWVGLIIEDKIPQAFNRTLPPGGRKSEARLLAENREELLIFRQSDLVRIALRNKGAATFEPGGMRDWQYKPSGIECVFTGTLKCPEGSFPVHVSLRGTEGVAAAEGAGAGRQWQIAPSMTGYIQAAGAGVVRTPYGFYVSELERKGTEYAAGFVRVFLDRVYAPPHERLAAQYFAFRSYTEPDGDPTTGFRVAETAHARSAVAGIVAEPFALPSDQQTKYLEEVRDRLFRLSGGGTPTPKQKEEFMRIWERGGIMPPGMRIRNNSDTISLINVTDSAVEVRVPVELPIPGDDLSAARGKVVAVCTDPAILDELKRVRAASDPNKPSDKPDEFRDRSPRWRILAVESDLNKVKQREQRDPGAMEGP